MTSTQARTHEQVQAVSPHHWRQGPLPEIIGYVGAALVVSAGLNLIGQTWDSWPKAIQLAVVVTGAVALYVASAVVTATVGGFAALRDHVIRRRLVGVLLAVAAPLIAASIAVGLDWAGISLEGEGNYWPLVMISGAVVGTLVAAWWAPGVVPTLAVAISSFIWLQIFIGTTLGPLEQPVVIAAVSAVATVGWLIIAPRLLPPRILTEALGVAGFIILQVEHAFMALDFPPFLDELAEQRLTWAMWFSRIALLVFATVALILFARGASWVWAAGGVVAAGAGALSIAGQTFGLIAGLFVAGIILLAVSGVLLVARGRRGSTHAPQEAEPEATSAPAP
ncbi:MAG: hypothetical protein ACO3ID_02055 [Candidatus Nanopelagicales bacterium]|jgi:hypothetical protein